MKELHDLLLNNAGNEKVIAMVCNFVNGQVKEADIKKAIDDINDYIRVDNFSKEEADEICRGLYICVNGKKVCGPFLSDEKTMNLYRRCAFLITRNNLWDFKIAINLHIAMYYDLFMSWWYSETLDTLCENFSDIAVTWLRIHQRDFRSATKGLVDIL